MFKHIGTVERQFCTYDNKEHEVTLTEYLVKLTGDTYTNRKLIGEQNKDSRKDRFYWDDMDKAWIANIDSEKEINRLYKVFNGTGVNFSLRPVFRITDM